MFEALISKGKPKGGITSAVGQRVFGPLSTGETATYSFTVPNNVYTLSAVVVGGGEGSLGVASGSASGGKGGNLRWRNEIPVTPGEVLKIVVGRRGNNGLKDSIPAGGNSYLQRADNSVLVLACGGGLTSTLETVASPGLSGGGYGGIGKVGNADYGGGGGGAGGYTGNGGDGGYYLTPGIKGSGGSGGGGSGYSYNSLFFGSCGGAVGLLGQGVDGAGGVPQIGNTGTFGSGRSGSGGSDSNGPEAWITSIGAGSGGWARNLNNGIAAGPGGVRLMWGPGRAYPSTLTADQTSKA
jgi:hypothetical protein